MQESAPARMFRKSSPDKAEKRTFPRNPDGKGTHRAEKAAGARVAQSRAKGNAPPSCPRCGKARLIKGLFC